MADWPNDGWYQATKPSATFGFLVQDNKVVIAAPYLRRYLIGQRSDYALDLLRKRGFLVEAMPGQ